jgi:hypothetical protein
MKNITVICLGEYPFQSLVEKGTVRQARSIFIDKKIAQELSEDKQERVFKRGQDTYFYTSGVRPYSYGL